MLRRRRENWKKASTASLTWYKMTFLKLKLIFFKLSPFQDFQIKASKPSKAAKRITLVEEWKP